MTSPIDTPHIFPEQDLSSLHVLGTALYKSQNRAQPEQPLYGYHNQPPQPPQHQEHYSPQLCMLLDTPMVAHTSAGFSPHIPVIDFTQIGSTVSSGASDSPTMDQEPYVIAKLPLSLYQKVLEMLQLQHSQLQVPSHIQQNEMVQHDEPVMSNSHHSHQHANLQTINPEISKSPIKKEEDDFHIKGSWTEEEDRRLVELVQKHGAKKWSFIATHLKGRIGKQCRERYLNHLDPRISKKAWTSEEDELILEMHKKHGNQWAKISRMLPGRTANAIKNHWNSTLSRRMDKVKKDDGSSPIPGHMDQMPQSMLLNAPLPDSKITSADLFSNSPSIESPNPNKRTLQEYTDSQLKSTAGHYQYSDTYIPPSKRVKIENEHLKLETDENLEFTGYPSSSSQNRQRYEDLRVQLNDEDHEGFQGSMEDSEDFDLSSMICATPKMGDCALSLPNHAVSRFMVGNNTPRTRSFLSPTSHLLLPNTPDAASIGNPSSTRSTDFLLWSPKSTKNSSSSSVLCS